MAASGRKSQASGSVSRGSSGRTSRCSSGRMQRDHEPFYDFPCFMCAKENKNAIGETYCKDCEYILCGPCLESHNKSHKSHVLMDTDDYKAKDRPKKEVIELPITKCSEHPLEIVDIYCREDDIVCCSRCSMDKHKNCKGVVYIPDIAKKVKKSPEFLDVNKGMDKIRADLEMLKRGKNLDLKRITEQYSQAKASIKEMCVEITQQLDEIALSAEVDLEKKFEFHKDEINSALAKLDGQVLKMKKAASKLKDCRNESQLYVDMNKAKMKLKEGRICVNEIEKSVEKPAIHFFKTTGACNVFDEKSLGTLEDLKSVNSIANHNGDFNVNAPNDSFLYNITSLCQMLTGNIVLLDFANEKIKLLDKSYNVIAECKLSGRIWGLCKTSPSEVAITLRDDKKVQFAEVTDTISLKESFSVGDVCRGIDYNDGLLYVECGGIEVKVLNEGQGQVRVYDLSGKHLNTFMKDKRSKNLFSIPKAIAVSECRTKLHVSDRDNGIVTMNLDGTDPWKFTHPERRDPLGFCEVTNGDLVVCGFESHNVILFDKNGREKDILLKKEGKYGIKQPYSVLYDKTKARLIVSMKKSNHIKVYDMN